MIELDVPSFGHIRCAGNEPVEPVKGGADIQLLQRRASLIHKPAVFVTIRMVPNIPDLGGQSIGLVAVDNLQRNVFQQVLQTTCQFRRVPRDLGQIHLRRHLEHGSQPFFVLLYACNVAQCLAAEITCLT